ncbi:MBL fold metallo-hydrolase [Gelidibacter maritimus]|uniref:MBL fold metallo-hydrolase n=1 Tax=Gelidibacter maritimus TaxID=2761487 RepID=A0A7W2M6L2_9FLAO|nr:MBL fold metallo-hydrolase [Gelidibacter maritimus]MBA6153661.1 MBL fold metallo-hydrolase [Gelidibacter maritimus]
MKHLNIVTALLIMLLMGCKHSTEKAVEVASEMADDFHESTQPEAINIIPINHATMILAYKDQVVYVDPVGGSNIFSDQEKPDYILITDIHGDHLDVSTLENMVLDSTTLIVPPAVKEKLPELKAKEIIVMNNGENKELEAFSIEAVPMYNLREEALKFHEKGRGNGYVLTWNNQRIYISGDTEDIPEMRSLENIDIAFVCMNLPYTMTVESAASAVLDFKPKKVYPYHYRGTDGMSDVDKFRSIVNKTNSDIEVVQLDWYE